MSATVPQQPVRSASRRLESLEAWARRHRRALVAGVVPLLLAITALDGVAVAAHFAWGRALGAVLTIAYWALLLCAASRRLRLLMIVGLLAATAGEVVFSLGLGMYEYRLGEIPLYVPPGHTVLYAAVFIFVRLPTVHRHARVLGIALFALGAAFSAVWWQRFDDTFGIVCFGLFCALLLVLRGARLFFVAMYLLVAYLELCGTALGAWHWPPVLMGMFEAVPSANPPSGVAVFYCLFDLCCLALYFGLRFGSFERWVQRLVAHRRARLAGS